MTRKTMLLKPVLCTATAIAALMGSTFYASAADNLNDALATAYLNNPDLEAARASQRAVDETVNQAIAGWRPTIVGTGQWSKQENERTGAFSNNATTTPKSIGISIEQPVFRSFQTVNGTKEARSNAEAGRAQLANTEQQILLNVVAAYSDVIRDEAFLEFTTNNVIALQRQLQASEDRFAVGEITRTDVAQSRARLSRAQSEKIAAEATLTASRAAFQRVVGNEPGTLEREVQLPPLPASEEAAYDIASRNHPLIVAANASEKAADYAVKKQYGGLGPTVNVGASWTKSWDSFLPGDRSTAKAIYANLRVPIYQAGIQASIVRQSKQRRSQFRMEAISAERQVQELVRNAWESYREASARIVSTQAQLDANEIALEGVRQEADVGSRTILDVLDAEQELLDARVNNARAVRDRTVAAYNLIANIGQLNATDLGLNVPFYDAEQRSKDVEHKIYGFSAGDND
ncbi:TolC family outer membrane protein [Pseudemcibacter aquimaris]|uniref:TolC family outer membrane protein n=1 Tax=Pseudemcibacter aquimaris TaxID=2857064 RepID=UPI002010F556|nr:TolC family outer membrane protein [Pseudemcibacter aquimaris]MCC3859795.1 TolC family outer membrane protein [Pseudemcibacter aquimaris]WDU60189.1 TolC family outer membrane protein [Pseudemcibacter aquimaris]